MKKICFLICLTLLLIACVEEKGPLVIEPTVENFARYIAEDYHYGESGEFIDSYLDNTYSTNLYLLNLLKDLFDNIAVESFDEAGALLRCDGKLVRMDIAIEDGKITKISVRGGGNE